MITGSRKIAGPIPLSHFEIQSVKFPAGQCGLILVVDAPPSRRADLFLVQEGKIRGAAALAGCSLAERAPSALLGAAPVADRSAYLFELSDATYVRLQRILHSSPELIIPYRLRARRFARAALRRLPEKPVLAEHRAWRKGMPSVCLLQCVTPLEFLDKAPPLAPGQLRLYDLGAGQAGETAPAAGKGVHGSPETPGNVPGSPEAAGSAHGPPDGAGGAADSDVLGQKLWNAYKRIVLETLGGKSRRIIERAEQAVIRRGTPGRISCEDALAYMDSAIREGPFFRRRELRIAARELINDLYARHARMLHNEGASALFQRYFSRWKGG